jgi:uroporphyrin-III C-methyltransferase
MTTASIAALRAADVVLYDRLVPSERLAELAPGAELIDVGKTPGHHAVPQSGIHSLLVEHALHGRSVVRLKGGDPFVFGRGGEEVAACREAGVPVRVLSGVTSAIAVPAAAGIPVTHRDVSRMFTVVSGHVPLDDVELSHLVGLASTIVVLMGVGTLPHLAAGLRRHGLSDAVPVAIVERGFSSSQRTTITTLGEIVGIASRVRVRSPAVLVIGEVVRWAASADVAAVELIDSAAVLLAEE